MADVIAIPKTRLIVTINDQMLCCRNIVWSWAYRSTFVRTMIGRKFVHMVKRKLQINNGVNKMHDEDPIVVRHYSRIGNMDSFLDLCTLTAIAIVWSDDLAIRSLTSRTRTQPRMFLFNKKYIHNSIIRLILSFFRWYRICFIQKRHKNHKCIKYIKAPKCKR